MSLVYLKKKKKKANLTKMSFVTGLSKNRRNLRGDSYDFYV